MLTQQLCPEVRSCEHILLKPGCLASAWEGALPLYPGSVTPPPGTPTPPQTAHSLPTALSSYLRSSQNLADVPVVSSPRPLAFGLLQATVPSKSRRPLRRPPSPPQAAVPSVGPGGAAPGQPPCLPPGASISGWSLAPEQDSHQSLTISLFHLKGVTWGL